MIAGRGPKPSRALMPAARFRARPGAPGVAHGGAPQVLRHLRAGDSIGNTSVIKDHLWEYTATAHEDTWTLSISRAALTDLLRGRAELAHAVLFGVYHTFTRRLQQVVAQGLSVKSEWLFAADVDKHTTSPRVGPSRAELEHAQQLHRFKSTDSFDLRLQ